MYTRLIVVEGIMGSGKSTLSRYIARQIERNGMAAVHVPESAVPHPTNVIRLPHEPLSWEDLDPSATVAEGIENWRRFLEHVQRAEAVHVLDGHLLHWDFTALLLADADPDVIRAYAHTVFELLRDVDASVIYLMQPDPVPTLRRIARIRGSAWVRRQIRAKVRSPFCRRLGLVGFAGWLELYRHVRADADRLLAVARLRMLTIDTTGAPWRSHYARTMRFLGLPRVFDWRFQATIWKRSLLERAGLVRAALRRDPGRMNWR